MSTIAIIGTAGRQTDFAGLTPARYKKMIELALVEIAQPTAATLVSGGAAWADHIAVILFLTGTVPQLRLHLPAPLTATGFAENKRDRHDPGGIANYYHRRFSQAWNQSSISQLLEAQRRGAHVEVTPGFKPRNTKVAAEAHRLTAFTFGPGPTGRHAPGSPGFHDPRAAGLKDGGTADTWAKATGAAQKIHFAIGEL